MHVMINLVFEANNENYSVGVKIPDSAPTGDNPFIFAVNRETEVKDSPQPILHVALGGDAGYFVGVEPPQSLMEKAGLDGIIKQLQVVVSQGLYDLDTKAFNGVPDQVIDEKGTVV